MASHLCRRQAFRALADSGDALLGAVLVDADDLREHESDVRVLVERGHALLQESGSENVVVGRPAEELAACALDGEVVVVRAAHVERIPRVPDARVASGELAADRPGVVGRCIVEDHQLEIAIGLGEDRLDGLGEVALSVVDGEPDADAGNRRLPGFSHAVQDRMLPSGHKTTAQRTVGSYAARRPAFTGACPRAPGGQRPRR